MNSLVNIKPANNTLLLDQIQTFNNCDQNMIEILKLGKIAKIDFCNIAKLNIA